LKGDSFDGLDGKKIERYNLPIFNPIATYA